MAGNVAEFRQRASSALRPSSSISRFWLDQIVNEPGGQAGECHAVTCLLCPRLHIPVEVFAWQTKRRCRSMISWRHVARAQWRVTWDAMKAWRGKAARARLRGQLAGLLGWPKMRKEWRRIEAQRQVDDVYLESLFTEGRKSCIAR